MSDMIATASTPSVTALPNRKPKKGLPFILLVDDEPQLVQSIAVLMRREFNVLPAHNAEEGFVQLREHPEIEVVVSDMRMPGMDGATFLAKVREDFPDVVRLLLTGQTDLQSAIKAVNEGQIFRFLSKPFQSELLAASLSAAVKQHRLAKAEKELLEQTLKGCVRVLTDVLALAHPAAFGRANRLTKHAKELADLMDHSFGWEFGMAAMLSQLGWIAIPSEIIEKVSKGEELSVAEEKMVQEVPRLAPKLLRELPRIDFVLEILTGLSAQSHRPSRVPLASRILRVVDAYDRLVSAGASDEKALKQLEAREGTYSTDVLQVLRKQIKGAGQWSIAPATRELPLAKLRPGMVLAYDVRMKTGGVFVARGFEITQGFLMRARNLRPGTLVEPICIQNETDL